jgi:DNA repair exonuclease SbcCD ATPase subunit
MRITRLHLRDLRRHADVELRPAAGLTVIRGPNEAGKTTVEQAIELALFGETGTPGDLRRWGAQPDAIPAIELDFEDGDVRGQLVRRFAESGATVELRIGDATITDPAVVSARLGELTGVPTLQFFRSTAAVRQGELSDLARGDATLRERLLTSMSAADRGLAESIRELESAIRVFDGDAAGPGTLRGAQEEAERLSASVEQGEAELAALAVDQEAVSASRTTLAEVEAKLEIDREQLSVAAEAVRVTAAAREAESALARLDRAIEVQREIETLQAARVAGPRLDVLRISVARVRELDATIATYRERLTSEVDISAIQVLAAEPLWRPFALASIVLAVVGVAAVALTQIPGLSVIAVLGLVYALYAVHQRRRIAVVRQENVLREEQIERRLRGRSDVAAQLRGAEQARAAELAALGAVDLAAAEEALAAEERWAARIEACRTELAALVSGIPAGSLLAARAAAADHAAERRRSVAELDELAFDPGSFLEACTAAVRQGEQARERARAHAIAAEARVEGGAVDAEAIAARAEALAAARERIAALERRRRILVTTHGALRDAEHATTRRAARFLEEYTGRALARITDGRYARVQLDEETLAMRAWSPERGGWVDVRALSVGTLDQAYMAARLGVVRHLTQGRRPPLVFDDPFITFDDDRAVRALEVLREVSAEYQAIYLTTSSRYDAVADLVVTLGGPADREGASGAADAPTDAESRFGDVMSDASRPAADSGAARAST